MSWCKAAGIPSFLSDLLTFRTIKTSFFLSELCSSLNFSRYSELTDLFHRTPHKAPNEGISQEIGLVVRKAVGVGDG